jgi:monovalent cation:H+ antiporter-2, CPA2 family
MMESFLLLASLYLGAAVLIVPISVRLGLGSVLGYLAAGMLIGPALGLAGAETRDLQHVAEYGVVMMLFLIGLELDPRALWAMRQRLIGLGGAQVGLTALAVFAIALTLGQNWQAALVLGFILALSSTAIVLQTLEEKKLMRSAGGRASFAVLLAQDLAVIPMLAIIPLLASPGARHAADAHADEGAAEPILTLVEQLPGWAGGLLTLAIVAAIVLAGHFLSRPAFRFIHGARLAEMSTFFSLFLVLGIAFLMIMVGLSPALGTFLAGVVLANSEFRHQLEADIKPFKGLLLGLFFMTVGIGIDMRLVASEPLRLILLTLGLIALKAGVLFLLARIFHLPPRDRWLFTFGLAQAGEFGFLIVSIALAQSILPADVGQTVLLIISLSMLLTPALFLLHDWLSRRLREVDAQREPDPVDERAPVLIAGIGRFGQVVNRLVRSSGVPTVVLDSDLSMVETMRRFGVKGYFGDPSRPELLESAGLMQAQILVVAVDQPEKATAITRFARQARPDLHIVARAHDRIHTYELFQAGANDIVRETFDSAIRAGRYVLENSGFSDYEAAQLSRTYFQMDRAGLRELAALWVPGQPVETNAAYVARAKELNADMETALIGTLEAERAGKDPQA